MLEPDIHSRVSDSVFGKIPRKKGEILKNSILWIFYIVLKAVFSVFIPLVTDVP